MNAQYLLLRAEKHFAESGRSFIFCHKTAGISHRKLGNPVFDAFMSGLFFGQTDRRDLRIGVDDTGNGVITHFVFQSGEVVDHHFAFATGCVGQHRKSCDIAGCVDIRYVCSHLGIDFDSSALCFYA